MGLGVLFVLVLLQSAHITTCSLYASSSYYIKDQHCLPNPETQDPIGITTADAGDTANVSGIIDQRGNSDTFPWFVYSNVTANRSSVELIKQICPNVQFCSDQLDNNNADVLPPIDKCCVPCGCTSDCYAIGNCCPDVKQPPPSSRDNVIRTQYLEECLYPEIVGSSQCGKHVKNTDSYMMIRVCPDSTNNVTLLSSCMFPDLRQPSTAIPVYSLSTGRNYANVYCAMCNIDKGDFKRWTGILISPFNTDINKFVGLVNKTNYLYILKYFSTHSMVWQPPNGTHFTRCYVEEYLISSCSRKHNLPKNNNIEEMCQATMLPYGYSGEMYKNVFCYGCSSYSEDIDSGSCTNHDIGRSSRVELVINTLDDMDSTMIVESQDLITNDDMCPIGYKYHSKTEECLMPSCPLFTKKIGDDCVRFYKEMKGINLHYQMNIRATRPENPVKIKDALSIARSVVIGENEDAKIDLESSSFKIQDGTVIVIVNIFKTVYEFVDLNETAQIFKYRTQIASRDQYKIEAAKPSYVFGARHELAIFSQANDGQLFREFTIDYAVTEIQSCNAIRFPINFSDIFKYKSFIRHNVTFLPSEYVMFIPAMEESYIHVCLHTYEAKKFLIENQNVATALYLDLNVHSFIIIAYVLKTN